MAYKIDIHRTAQKQILSFPRQAQVEIAQTIDWLAEVPRPPRCRKLQGTDLWRIRQRRYRIVYIIEDKARLLTVVKVALQREDIYKGL